MAKPSQESVNDKNLDRLSDFLTRELSQPALAEQIPSGAHIFHGAYNDMTLTQANLSMATKMLIAMSLDLQPKQALFMIFEYASGHHMVVNLATEERKRKVQTMTDEFQQQNQQELLAEINNLTPAA